MTMPEQISPSPAHSRHLRALRLTLAATDPTVAAALDTARHELAATLAATPPTPTTTTLRAALAALALGDDLAATQLLRLCAAHQTPAGTIPGPSAADDPTRLYLLLLARYLAWTGDFGTLREHWPHALSALAHYRSAPPHTGAADWAATLAELAIAAESIGDQATAALLQAESANAPAAHPRAPSEPGEPRKDAADIVVYYIDEILGVHPDAPRNRLVLRPWLPESWDHLELAGLRFGDAEVTLRYRRSGDRHHFTIEQESGAVPARLIFEPAIPANRLVEAIVDGQHAELDPIAEDGRLRVPIQVVLDTARELVFVGGSNLERGGRVRLPVR